MSPALPLSLSPHICILSSNDLTELLSSSSLPSLPHILQSFSPLPQVTTRTTSLVSVPHASFSLRFSDLTEIESACREDEERRAMRTIDWIGARIHKRCSKWVEDIEKFQDKDGFKTPWWDELRRCVEGDHVPSRTEAWNHPVAVILAVSTRAPNPLQAITALHSRPFDLPSWVDRNILRYTLIIHPNNSLLSDEEAGALFNAVKKQFGLHSYLLPIAMPVPPPPPVPVPALIPRLPPPPSPESNNITLPTPTPTSPSSLSSHPNELNTLQMAEKDIQQIARFTREFLVMSLLPWMEKCVVDWNENFSSTRRLPSRLFSSTRRLFGSPSPSPVPAHNPSSSSVSSLPSRPPLPASTEGLMSLDMAPPQQRRLAEFATILGDFKLAITVWEALRKEGKGGSDVLPLLLSPSPTSYLHASNALSIVRYQSSEPRAYEQLSALKYAIRWEAGIDNSDFINQPLEGERWLVWAAGNAEEPTSGFLLGHAALLTSKKGASRRAALWYLFAANILEKCGIKPLTMYFLRKAHGLYKTRPQKSLSPAFWESEGKSPLDVQSIDAIMLGIEHPLGRLLYSTGDVAAAVRLFLGLLRGSHGILPFSASSELMKVPSIDQLFLDDFRVAFAHFKSTSSDSLQLMDLKLPFSFCIAQQTRVRLPGNDGKGVDAGWTAYEEHWRRFWMSRNPKESFSSKGKAAVNETFWVDLVLVNPLDAEVNLANLTLLIKESGVTNPSSSTTVVEIESIDNVGLAPKESRTVSICVKSTRAASFAITHATYDFLSLLPSVESLASRGRRLHDTVAQRQKATYASDISIEVEVEEKNHRILVGFTDNRDLVLAQGETKTVQLQFSNIGQRPITEVWMVAGSEDVIWVGPNEDCGDAFAMKATEIIRSHNSLALGRPHRIISSVGQGSDALIPGSSIELPALLHAESTGSKDLHLLFAYREDETSSFQFVRVRRSYEVHKVFNVSVVARPCQSLDYFFLVDLELANLSSSEEFRLTQVTSLSATWKCSPIAEYDPGNLAPCQSSRFLLGAVPWDERSSAQETLDFISEKLGDVLHGRTVELSNPPPVNLLYNHISEAIQPLNKPSMQHLLRRAKQNAVSRAVIRSHPHIPSHSHPYIFPLYNPASVDFIVFWDVPLQQRSGHILISGLTLGASHAALAGIIEKAEAVKTGRSMYAESQREKEDILVAIRDSEWNAEMNPLILVLQEPDVVVHNFEQGPCRTPITLTLRNYSSTHRTKFVLRLDVNSAQRQPAPNLLPPPYIGRITFRGILEPFKSTTIRPTLWITRPGTYSLGRWSLETEVLESLIEDENACIRQRYRQELAQEDRHIIVCAP